MADPVDVEVDATVEQLFRRLQNSHRDLFGGLRRVDRQVTTRLLGPDRTFTATPSFGLADFRMVRQLLAENFTPPTGGFSITLGGIRQLGSSG